MTNETPTCEWYGKSGTRYVYYIHPIGTSMRDLDGNYIYARVSHVDERGAQLWAPVYIGQGNLKERSAVDSHHNSYCLKRSGATHFQAHTNSNKNSRLFEERDIIGNYTTPCNG